MDWIFGEDSSTMNTVGGNDSITGDEGTDYLDGGPGLDSVSGGADNDTIRARDNAVDQVTCDAGDDTVIVDPVGNHLSCEHFQ